MSGYAIDARQYGELLCSRVAAKNARLGLPHQAPSARVMSGMLSEHMLEVCRSAPKRPQEVIEVISPRRALAPDEISEPSRTSSDCSRGDRKADKQDWRQEIMDFLQAELDEHVLHYKEIIAAKTKRLAI